jgi:hypothetical protein
MKKPRRNSCPYIKPLLQLDKNGDNLPSQKWVFFFKSWIDIFLILFRIPIKQYKLKEWE